MNRAEYNVWRKNANKQPSDQVDMDEEWDELDVSHCILFTLCQVLGERTAFLAGT
jgi:hypothetical protein